MVETMNKFQLIGQAQTRNYWDTLISSGKFGHAHILDGHSGVGKDALAFYIAAALNCRSDSHKPCGNCTACHQFLNHEHSALQLIFALPRRSASHTDPFAGIKGAEMKLINQELAKKVAWPYYQLQIEAANDIRISAIRKLRKDIYLANDPGSTRVVIILRAHKMNVEAANALLKILEEPPSGTIFLLTTEYADRLPDTIRSRCALHHVPDLSWKLIQEDLLQKTGVDQVQAEICARISMGDLAAAHRYAEQDNTFWLDRIRATLNALAREDFVSVYQQVLILTDKEEQTDGSRQQFLALLILFFRDVALHTKEGETTLWVSQVQQMNKLFPACDSRGAIQAIERTKNALERKVHLQLALTALFFELRKHLRADTAQDLKQPE
jgi:DNA polymerase-3 subunit delta'